MTKKKRILLSILICLSLCGCEQIPIEEKLPPPTGIEINSTSDAISAFLDGVEQNEDFIYFYTDDDFDANDITSAVSRKAVQAERTYAMCNISGCTMTKTQRDDGYTEITIEMRYYMSKDETDYVEQRTKQIAEYLKRDTDYETYEAIYEWVCTHVKYDYDTVNGDANRFSAYDALKEGKSVCYGYAALFQKFCDHLGLYCTVLTSLDNTAHAWNVVKLNDEYYHVDCTYGSSQEETPDWRYFLCGQDKIKYGSGYGIKLAKESWKQEE